MTQEEKAKRYDDLLVKLQKAKTDNNVCDDRYCCVIDDIVPELKESEDEKIMKALKQYFVNSFQNNGVAAICGVHIKDILAWLEKQGKQKPQRIISAEAKEAMYDKPAWSEEDEKFFKTALWHISYSISNGKSTDFHCDTTEWLKSLKDRVLPKQEWNDEEKRALNDAIVALSMYANGNIPNILPSQLLEDVEQLESLKNKIVPQSHWKPSDEQMAALDEVIRNPYLSTAEYNGLVALREQLKAL